MFFEAKPRHHIEKATRYDKLKPRLGVDPWNMLVLNFHFCDRDIQSCTMSLDYSLDIPLRVFFVGLGPIINTTSPCRSLPHLLGDRPRSGNLWRAWRLSATQNLKFSKSHNPNSKVTPMWNCDMFYLLRAYYDVMLEIQFNQKFCFDFCVYAFKLEMTKHFRHCWSQKYIFVPSKLPAVTCIHQYMLIPADKRIYWHLVLRLKL